MREIYSFREALSLFLPSERRSQTLTLGIRFFRRRQAGLEERGSLLATPWQSRGLFEVVLGNEIRRHFLRLPEFTYRTIPQPKPFEPSYAPWVAQTNWRREES